MKNTPPTHVSTPYLTDVRDIGRAGILTLTHHLISGDTDDPERPELARRLRLAHRVWLRATDTDDFDVQSWESFFHHPEFPEWADVRALLTAMDGHEPGWRTGIDLMTAIQRVQAALPAES